MTIFIRISSIFYQVITFIQFWFWTKIKYLCFIKHRGCPIGLRSYPNYLIRIMPA